MTKYHCKPLFYHIQVFNVSNFVYDKVFNYLQFDFESMRSPSEQNGKVTNY